MAAGHSSAIFGSGPVSHSVAGQPSLNPRYYPTCSNSGDSSKKRLSRFIKSRINIWGVGLLLGSLGIPLLNSTVSCQSGGRVYNGKLTKIRKWEKNGQKMENGPRPETEKKRPKKRKNGVWGHFSPFLDHFFPISGRGAFSIFWPIFPIFGFRPVFHSVPGGLTNLQARKLIPDMFSELFPGSPVRAPNPIDGPFGHSFPSSGRGPFCLFLGQCQTPP